MDKIFSTPILFLIFNRPLKTEKVFEKIRQLKPKYLFVSADGPRKDNAEDKINCEKTRDIIKRIDWDCKVKNNYIEENAGCKIGVSSGITWFFNNVEEGIILEDDCVPDISFFYFCEKLLENYKHEKRIMHIGGTNLQDGIKRGNASFYFSRFNHVWGWATWRRAWHLFDMDITDFPKFKSSPEYISLLPDQKKREYWNKNFSQVFNKQKDTWDYQWTYTIWKNNGLAVVPNINLVNNIGFDEEATHTILKANPLGNRPIYSLNVDELAFPDYIEVNQEADEYVFRKYYNQSKFQKLKNIFYSYFR